MLVSRGVRTTLAAALTGFALVAGGVLPADATVPPKNCGTVKPKKKRYKVKADQVSCKTAKRAVVRWFTKRRKPAHYKCQTRFPSNSSYRLYCHRGSRTIFAIKP